MIFSSNIFIFLFLPIFLAIYFFLLKIAKSKMSILNITLVLLSLFYYFWGNREYLAVIIISILINYYLGKQIHIRKKPNWLLTIGLFLNLGTLLYFKLQIFNSEQSFIPIGISFYTFMAVSYLIDVYRKKSGSASLLDFSTYLTLFPHLVAGPIVRYQDIEKEIKHRLINQTLFFEGIVRFSFGLGKKVIIANNLAQVVDKIFALPPSELTFALAWIGIVVYSFQIYYDFSGYSDMAIGLALFFGFHFPENFNNPYRSTSISNFWQRWHISLSGWLRDYLYIPLGGNRKGNLRTNLHLLIVFVVCGFWHGATLTFIIWGIYHGILMVLERSLFRKNFENLPMPLTQLGTFLFVTLGWIFFRAPTLTYALIYWKNILSFSNIFFISNYYRISYFLPLRSLKVLIIAIIISMCSLPKWKSINFIGIFALIILFYSLTILSKSSFTPFIYFKF
jgi:alginate O-acetyltransferase complex protein AlgI